MKSFALSYTDVWICGVRCASALAEPTCEEYVDGAE